MVAERTVPIATMNSILPRNLLYAKRIFFNSA